MSRKPFAIGARIEHRQERINRAQYGPAAGHPALGAADYKLAVHLSSGRSVYTFCMCPGGQVVAAASEAGGVVVQAHPFRVRDYIPAPWEELPAEHLDGVEVYNACNDDLSNLRALGLAERLGGIATAGSDSHSLSSLGQAGIACERRIRTERELVDLLRSGDYELYTNDGE
jgi:hypothetical protein